MKDKIKDFLSEKKELLIFLGVLIFTFVTVFTIAYSSVKDSKNVSSDPDPIVTPDPNGGNSGSDKPTPAPDDGNGGNDTPAPQPMAYIGLPVAGTYVITRQYFDIDDTSINIDDAIISNGNTFIPSRGISYAKESNESFEVLAIYTGTVTSVFGDEESLDGYTVTIDHENGMKSVYYSLDTVKVSKGDKVVSGQVLGNSGTSVSDLAAKVHVHLEILVDGKYINPTTAIGKELTEVVSSMK